MESVLHHFEEGLDPFRNPPSETKLGRRMLRATLQAGDTETLLFLACWALLKATIPSPGVLLLQQGLQPTDPCSERHFPKNYWHYFAAAIPNP